MSTVQRYGLECDGGYEVDMHAADRLNRAAARVATVLGRLIIPTSDDYPILKGDAWIAAMRATEAVSKRVYEPGDIITDRTIGIVDSALRLLDAAE